MLVLNTNNITNYTVIKPFEILKHLTQVIQKYECACYNSQNYLEIANK